MNWILTLPQTIPWARYQKELDEVADGASNMHYRTAYFPKGMAPGDRCYVVHKGRVRGWMRIVSLVDTDTPWTCESTGTIWPPGKYIARSGPFYEVRGPAMRGFRGVRKHEGVECDLCGDSGLVEAVGRRTGPYTHTCECYDESDW